MLLHPKKTKYKKLKKGKLKKFNHKNHVLKYGNVGLKIIESGRITSRQLESARRTINRKIKRKGKVWIRVYPNLPITSKSNESRMGKGKGNISYWCAKVTSGTLIFEIMNKNVNDSIKSLLSGGNKLPLKSKIIIY